MEIIQDEEISAKPTQDEINSDYEDEEINGINDRNVGYISEETTTSVLPTVKTGTLRTIRKI